MDMELAPTPAFRKMSESIAESVSDDPLEDFNVSQLYRMLRLLLIFAMDYYVLTVNKIAISYDS